MSTGRARRGHSLLELTIASALFLLLMVLIWELFVAMKRAQDNTEAKITLQDNVLKGLSKMQQEMIESDRYAVQVSIPNKCVIFSTPRGMDGHVQFDVTGRMLWKKYVLYYVGTDSEGNPGLIRKVQELSPWASDVPAPINPIPLRDDPASPARLVAKYISNLTPKANPDGTFELKLQGQYRLFNRLYAVEVTGTVFPNN